jgi:hypothetical protein
MFQITLRGIDNKTERMLRREARKKGVSLSTFILDMIGQRVVQNKEKKELSANSLRKLAGGWSRKEAERFTKSIESCGDIDETM